MPAKVVWYFPSIPRFKRMFQSGKTAKSLTWHADRKSVDGHMFHPADSPSWKLVDDKWPEFGKEPRNLRLALSFDGFNPHSSLSSRYSCWPVILVTYNLPPWQRPAFNGKPEYGTPLEPLTGEEVLLMVESINYKWGSKNGGNVDENDGDRVCWKKKIKFFDLEYWKYLPVRHVLDVMHIEKNVCNSIIGTLLEIPGKNENRERHSRLLGSKSHNFHTLMQQLLPMAIRSILEKPARYMKVLKGYVQNRAHLEGCIAEQYIVEKAVEFCTKHLSDVNTSVCLGEYRGSPTLYQGTYDPHQDHLSKI
ncbi:hypothetical protein L3X38_041857 [Prunus dulcis]|uniref:DUF4218 domain-containing protein n=1 Tax=Prunus dulcis TaxID=3755 RepID=A0AAD4YLA7_PRUDU|nr:hypothetical protein L3X38_041857 [Prunus dulcis]